MPQTHDQLMKELITAFPAQFLELAAPDLAQRLALESLEFEPREHYPGGPSQRERRTDLVALFATGDSKAVVNVEIELRYLAIVAPKLLHYHRGLSLRYELPVHTIVMYIRGGPPGHTRNIYTESSLGRKLVDFHYDSLGLSQTPASEYLARSEPLAWALAALMKPARGLSKARLGLSCLRRITSAPCLEEKQRSQLCNVVTSYIELDDAAAEELEMLLAEQENRKMEEMITTWAERMETNGRRKGTRDLVLRLLRQRFGELSAAVQRQITEIDSVEELSRLAEKVYQVGSIEELGLASA